MQWIICNKTFLLSLFFLLIPLLVWAQQLPAYYKAEKTVNVRREASVQAEKIAHVQKGHSVTIDRIITGSDGRHWGHCTGVISPEGWVCIDFMHYEEPVKDPKEESFFAGSSFFNKLNHVGKMAWEVVRIILIIAFLVILYMLKDVIFSIAAYYILFAIIGAIIGAFFGAAGRGAEIACLVLTVAGAIYLLAGYGRAVRVLFICLLAVPLVPLYLLNQLQWFLVAPWRWLFKSDWPSEGFRAFLRPVLTTLTILLTIAATPLRLVNSVAYNVLHFVYDFYNYLIETFAPSSDEEGADNVWKWLLHFFRRFFKYPIWHGLRSLWDCLCGIVTDIFVPTLTMYHGTNQPAADSILADADRNSYQKENTDHRSGVFASSTDPGCSWGGLGVYFAKSLWTALRYANDPGRNGGYDPVVLVSRVSYGLIINYSLAPNRVSDNTGRGGNHKQINAWSMPKGYTTGEWWNGGGKYWEYCLFDWHGPYNHPWRIRTIWAFNLDTFFFHRIKGGMAHWEIGKIVLDWLYKH